MKLIAEGAEAKIYLTKIDSKNYIIKERVPKTYRIKEIDEYLRKTRTRKELRILEKASKIINVPKLYSSSSEKNFKIVMEYLDGKKLADHLDSFSDKERVTICKNVGKQVALMHNHNIIHGDLTTSNMILKNNDVFLIDFGLGFISDKIEHKAVDLHLIEQALESKHYINFKSSFEAIINSYKKYSNNFKLIFDRLDKVGSRGRYKSKNKFKN